MTAIMNNLWWIGPLAHILITFIVADVVGTIIYKRTRKTPWSSVALQVHPLITFVSGILFVFFWIPCR